MGTHYQGTSEEVNALNVFIKLSRSMESMTACLAPGLKKHELTGTQLGVMEAIYHFGKLNQRDLGTKLLKSGGNITLVVDNLEKRGFVERERCSPDGRA